MYIVAEETAPPKKFSYDRNAKVEEELTMSRVFLLGAGFSKAVADLPTSRQLLERMRREYQQRMQSTTVPSDAADTEILDLGRRLVEFLDRLEDEHVRAPLQAIPNSMIYRDSNFFENVELILTFVDLHLMEGPVANVGEEGAGYSVIKERALGSKFDMQQIRLAFEIYTYLLVRPLSTNQILSQFGELLADGDAVVRFNYDLLVESELLRRGLWSPIDGYGLNGSDPSIKLKLEPRKSKIAVLKLHGSINWQLPNTMDGIRIKHWDLFGEPYFPRLLDRNSSVTKSIRRQSGRFGFMPSFVKPLGTGQMLFGGVGMWDIWRQASESLRKADEVVLIGYSLPEADAAASILVAASIRPESKLVVVDPVVEDIAVRLCRLTAHSRIYRYETLEEYLHQLSSGNVYSEFAAMSLGQRLQSGIDVQNSLH